MEKKNPIKDAQGAGLGNAKVPEVAEIRNWVRGDLKCAIALLQTLSDDEDLLIMVSQFLQGRIINHESRKAVDESRKALETIDN